MRSCLGFNWAIDEGGGPLDLMVVSTGVCCGREGHRGGGVEVVVIVLAGYLPFLLYLNFYHLSYHVTCFSPFHFTFHSSPKHFSDYSRKLVPFSLLSLPFPYLPLSSFPGSLLVTCRCKSFNPYSAPSPYLCHLYLGFCCV